jgi:hypothetical protein
VQTQVSPNFDGPRTHHPWIIYPERVELLLGARSADLYSSLLSQPSIRPIIST